MEITKFVDSKAYVKKADECSERIAEMMKALEDIDEYINIVKTYKCTDESDSFYIVSEDSFEMLEAINGGLKESNYEIDKVISLINSN